MRMQVVLLVAGVWLVTGMGFLTAADENKEAAVRKARKEMEGTWQAVSYALDGKKASDDDLKKIKLLIDSDGKATAQQEGKTFIASTTKIDPTRKPKTIDITYTVGELKGQTALGIYKIEGETLTICRAAPGKDRPTEFASKAGSGNTLMVYQREKPGAGKTKTEAIQKDRNKYQGTWRVVSMVMDGNMVPEEDCKKITVLNEADGKWTIEVEGNTIARGTSEIDPTKRPKTIDFTPTEGENIGMTSLGIYELKDDTRKLCYAQPGRDRPTGFSSEPGSGHTLVTFKREKP